ncbi:cullin-3 [Dermacentor silvarum]|uniref:cullin-3 n=1 Tax=Dermacentor silvarum TaxID=543639 RepID=UPI0018977A0A|nr:cullin-3 [Dermacentor silvarum]
MPLVRRGAQPRAGSKTRKGIDINNSNGSLAQKKDDDKVSARSGPRRQLDAMAWLSAKKNAKVVRVLQRAPPQMEECCTEDIWLELRRAFSEIQEKRSTSLRFDKLYRHAHAMVMRNEGALLYHGLREAVTEHLTTKVRALVLAKVDDDFLQTLIRAWKDHQTSMAMIGDVVTYMDRIYVPQNNVDSVSKLGVSLFRDEVARNADVRDHIRGSLLGLVKTEREGKPVDRLSMKEACEMLVSLELDSRSVYKEVFEQPFLKESAEFYALRAHHYIETMDVLEYIAKIQQHITEESERARQCLDDSTVASVVQVVENELVGKYIKAILEMEDSGVVHMLKHGMTEELACTFRLLKCVQGGLKALLDCTSKYLRDVGKSIVSESGDSVSLIPKVIELKDRFDHFLKHSFNDEQLAKQMITADFEYILGLTRKSPELLSQFVDDMLRKGIKGMTEPEIDQLLDTAIATFRFLQEKDLFDRYYKQHLAKRLLLNKSASIDAERSMVAKLKNECGGMFTSKMEAMFKDINFSDNMILDFKAVISSCGMDLEGVDLNQSNIPAAPRCAFETFKRFYLARHDGRRLTLQPQLGWADMSAVFYGPWKNEPCSSQTPDKPQPRTYTIQVSTYQMCVLMLFNGRDKISYEDIASETDIPETNLTRALHSLYAATASEPVLTKTPNTKEIDKGHIFAVNEAFTSGMQKVKIQTTSGKKDSSPKNDGNAGNEGNVGNVGNMQEERRYELEAAIVRIMKARKTLSHDDLLVEVTNVLKARYTPTPAAFKKRVDALIEREYLERDTEDPVVYVYMP